MDTILSNNYRTFSAFLTASAIVPSGFGEQAATTVVSSRRAGAFGTGRRSRSAGTGEVAGDGRESGAKQAEKPPDMRATDRSRPSVDRLRERFRTTIMGGDIVYSSFFS